MEITNNLEGLSSLLGINTADISSSHSKSQGTAQENALGTDRATLSSAASEMSQASISDGVRMDKVAAVQAALAEGTYSVPASEVASKVIDAMFDEK